MPNMDIPRVNGRIIANARPTSSYYSKNKIGKLTDKNFIENILRQEPDKYDKAMIRLFTDTQLYSNDFIDLVMKSGKQFGLNDPNGVFTYKIKKRTELPKIIVNLADSTARPGIDNQTFELVFDKDGFSAGDIITAHRREQETQVRIVKDAEPYQNYFKYVCSASADDSTSYVHQRFLSVGTEYFKIGNALGEFTTEFSTLGLMDGSLEVQNDVLQQYGVESSLTDWADATKLAQDRNGNPLDITYYTVSDIQPDKSKSTTQLLAWEPMVSRMMRMEMMRMKANTLMWGRSGNGKDNKGNPVRAKAGLWQQLHLGNVIYYDRGQFSLNLVRSAVGDLFYNRVPMGKRYVKIYTNRSGMELASTAMRQDFNGQGFILEADKFLDGADRLGQGYAIGFDHFQTRETGLVEFQELEQLNESATFIELGPNKKTPPIFIILDVSNEGGSNIREAVLNSRPNMYYHAIPGTTGSTLSKMMGGYAMAASKDPYDTYVMKGWCGIFLEDPTRSVLIKEYPQY